ncbi:efflux RND transporter permease subunit, partial [Enterobacter asburiae]
RRFRAVMMTAVSFIIGVLPMMLGPGAGGQSRPIIRTTVLTGMLVATLVGLSLINKSHPTRQPRPSRISSFC